MRSTSLVELLRASDLLVIRYPNGDVLQRFRAAPRHDEWEVTSPAEGEQHTLKITTSEHRQSITKALVDSGRPFDGRDTALAFDLLRAEAVTAFAARERSAEGVA